MKDETQETSDKAAPGNAAAMRVALDDAHRMIEAFLATVGDRGMRSEFIEMRHRIDAALAAPARNCDKYSLDDIKKMDRDFGAFCKQFGAKNGENCSGCPIKPMDNFCCHSTWMLLPAAEGGGHA